MAFAAIASRGLGFVKATLLVAAIGGTASSVGGQAFGVANELPTNLFNLIAGGLLSAILFPQIMRVLRSGGSQRELHQLFTVVLTFGGLATATVTLMSPLLVKLYAPTWSDSWLSLATLMAYWCLPQLFLFFVYAIFGQLLNAQQRYGPFAWAPAASNVIAITTTTVFLLTTEGGRGGVESWTPGMVALICGGTLGGALVQAIIVVVALRSIGYRYQPAWGYPQLGEIGRVAFWMLGGAFAGQIAYVFTSIAANNAGKSLHDSGVDGASLNSYALAFLLFLVPHGVFTVSIVTELFTRVSRTLEDGGPLKLVDPILSGLRSVATFSFLATAGFVVLGPLVTRLVWGTPVIGVVLAFLAVGLVPFSQTYLLNRTSIALRDTRAVFLTQVAVGAVTAAGSITAGVMLPSEFVVYGIAIATSLAQIVGWFVALSALNRRLTVLDSPNIRLSEVGRNMAPTFVAAAVSLSTGTIALITSASLHGGWAEDLLRFIIVAIIGSLTFALITKLWKPSRSSTLPMSDVED